MVSKKLAHVLVTATLAVTPLAFAGDFSVSCTYKNNNFKNRCATVLSDIVTEKFTMKFPSSKFEIFVYSNIIGFTNGGFSAHAVAGVVQKNSGQFPVNAFSSTLMNGTEKKFSQIDLANSELENYRAAVKSLMEQCEISPDCDVYEAYKK